MSPSTRPAGRVPACAPAEVTQPPRSQTPRCTRIIGMAKFGDFIGHQTRLAPVENVLSAVANTTFNKLMPIGQKVRNLLHGT